MNILGWIIIGGIAGWLAAVVTGQRQGCLLNVAIGVVGALIGSLIFSALGGTGITGFNIWSFFVAFVGAVVFLLILNAFRR